MFLSLFSTFIMMTASNPEHLVAGATFKDCSACPEMVVIPPGQFVMGSRIDLPNRQQEKPLRAVTISYPFAVGKYEVTFDEWDACVLDGGCEGYSPNHIGWGGDDEPGWGRGARPVFRISWNDAKSYIKWLNEKSGHTYRLLTEAEWEYMARAGTTTEYSTGDEITHEQANFAHDGVDYGMRRGNYEVKALPVTDFPPNAFGVHGVHGGIYEWVEDCWHRDYKGAPIDGSAWMFSSGTCDKHVIRGGSWNNKVADVRSSMRGGYESTRRSLSFGFRLAKDMPDTLEKVAPETVVN